MLPSLSHGLQAEGIKPMFYCQGKTELECKQQKETGRVFVFLKLQNRLNPARHRRHADTRRHSGPPPCLSGALIRRNLLWGMTGECTRCCHYKSTSPSARGSGWGGGVLGAPAEQGLWGGQSERELMCSGVFHLVLACSRGAAPAESRT